MEWDFARAPRRKFPDELGAQQRGCSTGVNITARAIKVTEEIGLALEPRRPRGEAARVSTSLSGSSAHEKQGSG